MKLAMSSVTAVISYFLCIFLRYFDDEIQNTLLVMQGIVPYPLRLVLADEVLNLAPTTSEEGVSLRVASRNMPVLQDYLVSVQQEEQRSRLRQEAIVEKAVALNEYDVSFTTPRQLLDVGNCIVYHGHRKFVSALEGCAIEHA